MGQTAAVSFGAPFGRSIRVRFRIQMFRCMNWIAIKRLRTAPARALVANLELGQRKTGKTSQSAPRPASISYGHGNNV